MIRTLLSCLADRAASIRLAFVMAGVFVWAMWEAMPTSHHYDLIDHGP
jgi:hypothetical protein